MKKIVLFLCVIVLFFSCHKSKSDGSSVRYEFTSDVAASYTIEYSSNVSTVQTETFQGTTWSKTVTVKPDPNAFNLSAARMVAYPPTTWANTTNSAHVSLKVFVDNNEKASTDSLMTASNVCIGILELYSF